MRRTRDEAGTEDVMVVVAAIWLGSAILVLEALRRAPIIEIPD